MATMDVTIRRNPPTTELVGKRQDDPLGNGSRTRRRCQLSPIASRLIIRRKNFTPSGHVVITQDPKILTRSDEAKYDQNAQTIHLYGPTRIFVHVADAKGSGDFTSEEGWVTLDPKHARIVGHVQGHVIPALQIAMSLRSRRAREVLRPRARWCAGSNCM